MKKEKQGRKTRKYIVLSVLLLAVIFVGSVMFINSKKPGEIDSNEFDSTVKGSAFISTNQILIKQMSENWMVNDCFWPTALLDNIPNFQIGELEVVRYNTRILRDNLSRMRTTDQIDSAAETAFTALSNDPRKWWFPSAESKWKKSWQSLEKFNSNLATGESFFYPRADNLAELFKQYASLMGGANTRLVNAPRDMKRALIIDDKSTFESKSSGTADVGIPWFKIDDNLYYAQGIAYALFESIKAIRIDFYDVLVDKNSLKLLDKILEDLQRCSFEPLIVFNGNLNSIFANHSLNLSGVFNDARQKINSLVVSLKQG